MKKVAYLFAIVAALSVGFGVGCCYYSAQNKVAVVNVPVVVEQSAEVKSLREEQALKAQELEQWLQNARKDVESETDKEKQEALLQKYNAEFAVKREELQKDYAEKVKSVDEKITQTISDFAKKKGYKLVVAKAFAIYGGDDITEEVAAIVK